MKMTRRELIYTTGSLALSGWLGPVLSNVKSARAVAADAAPHFFVLVRTFGGMDVTLGLDPWEMPKGADEKDMFIEYLPNEILSAGGLKLAPAAEPLVPHASSCLVVNGVMMRRDAGHDVINQYMITGRGDGKAASVPAELGMSLGAGPAGLVANGFVYLAGKALPMTATQDVLSEMDQSKLISLIEARVTAMGSGIDTPLVNAQRSVVAGKKEAQKLFEYLKQFQGTEGKIDDRHVIAAALASGASRFGQLDPAIPNAGIGLDTHAGHEGNHKRVQKAYWQWVAELFSLFKKTPYLGGSLFDATTFMVISEWSRTPALNAAKGKDHNPFTNSVLLAGKGIRGGTLVGASKLITRAQTGTSFSDHIAWPYDYKAKKLAEGPQGASFIYPENIVRTVGEIFGNPAGFLPVPPETAVVPGIMV